MSIYLRLKIYAFRIAMRLPRPMIRVLAAPRITLDGNTLDDKTRWMLRLERLTHEPVVGKLAIPVGRVVLRHQSIIAGGRQPIGHVDELEVPGAAGPLPARLYVPHSASPVTGLLVFFHGGGYVHGDLDTHDAPCRFLAEHAGVRVLSVAYRLAPEHPFPAAHDDGWAALTYIHANASSFGADPARIAVGGDSAGGNLAAASAIRAAQNSLPLAFQLLIYPVADYSTRRRSRELFGKGFWLTEEYCTLAETNYPGKRSSPDPRASVMLAQIPTNLAPAYIATAGFDPLRDDGDDYAQCLAATGITVEHRNHPGLIHSFFNAVGDPGAARDAVDDAARALRAAIGAPAN